MHASTVAIDLAKEVFELAFADACGRVIERKRLSRKAFARSLEQRPPLRVLMEAIGARVADSMMARASTAHPKAEYTTATVPLPAIRSSRQRPLDGGVRTRILRPMHEVPSQYGFIASCKMSMR